MAKIKFGALVVDGRGKLGGHVLAQNRGGSYIRTKVTPANPQSVAQMAVRGSFAAISSGWSQLTEAQRDSFDSLVSAYSRTNVFGDIKNPSGKALYQRLNQNLANTGQTLITVGVNPLPLPSFTIDAVEAIVTPQSFDWTLIGDLTGSYVMVFATPPMTQGTKFVKNKLRLLNYQVGSSNTFGDFITEYTAKFGAIALGQNIVCGIKIVNANGQASPLQTVKVTVSAT